jgi:hypothetical protein
VECEGKSEKNRRGGGGRVHTNAKNNIEDEKRGVRYGAGGGVARERRKK